MLHSKIIGIRLAALSTTLPVETKLDANHKKIYVCDDLQTTSDLGFDAATRLLSNFSINKEDIGILLFGSRTPDYRSPNTAAILQGRLDLPIDCICFDTNVGANGFIKMIHVAASLLSKSNQNNALVIIGDTPSKLSKNNLGGMFELSDAATAVLLQKTSPLHEMSFSAYSVGDLYKGSFLREGGFRDFNENIPFDGSKPENYIVKSDNNAVNDFFANIQTLLNIEDDLIHSFVLENSNINDIWKKQRLINSDASELPLLLENILNQNLIKNEEITFVSAGEGMALMKMKVNHLPEVLPHNNTLEFFKDYKVSHEM